MVLSKSVPWLWQHSSDVYSYTRVPSAVAVIAAVKASSCDCSSFGGCEIVGTFCCGLNGGGSMLQLVQMNCDKPLFITNGKGV